MGVSRTRFPLSCRRRFSDLQLLAQHGDGVKLAVRAEDSPDGASLGEITSRGRVHCVGTRGPWLRVLYKGYKVWPCFGGWVTLLRRVVLSSYHAVVRGFGCGCCTRATRYGCAFGCGCLWWLALAAEGVQGMQGVSVSQVWVFRPV